ncbi:uncharacterized protein LOC143853740 [Tasmannia lanceolata]|uniref:uncharacterized protein LOC143853740 n=1 Tax=Tasmannia lanceolata TaxID=3420 RepID=UPI0040627C6B
MAINVEKGEKQKTSVLALNFYIVSKLVTLVLSLTSHLIAENTRLKSLDDAIKKLIDTTTSQETRLQNQQELAIEQRDVLLAISNKLTALDGRVNQLSRRIEPGDLLPGGRDGIQGGMRDGIQEGMRDGNNFGSFSARQLRLEFPRFEGTDPTAWISKANKFFRFHHTSDELKLEIASFHLDGKAYDWFQAMEREQPFGSWTHLARALQTRFGPSIYDNPQGKLAKLMQTSTVGNYQAEFDALANRTLHLPSQFLVDCFVSGLKPEIKNKDEYLESEALITDGSTSLLDTSVANPEISYYALTGQANPKTLRVTANINGKIIRVLIDGGSSNNFVQERLVQYLQLPMFPEMKFHVMVGNGERLECSGLCKNVTLAMQNHKFQVDLFVLPLMGADIVLGVQWLELLGPIIFDYKRLTMDFQWKNQAIHLQGENRIVEEPLQFHTFKRLALTSGVQMYFQLQLIELENSAIEANPNNELKSLLDHFAYVFEEPKSLPPARSHDHAIPLKFGTAPIKADTTHYTWRHGLLLYKGKIIIPTDSGLKTTLLQEFHSSPVGGHAGISRTMARIGLNFHWAGLKKDVRDFVSTCVICQQTKSQHTTPSGLLQPLPIPEQILKDWAMDFITSLPNSQDICKLHGIPKSIVSDRDAVFLSRFWRELFKLQRTTLAMSSAYHPQSDGQSEALNRCLEMYLRSYVCDCPAQWSKFLPWAEFWYNTSFHSAARK